MVFRGTALLLIALGAARTENRSPVIVELFTSEGCSSCPPADALLENLASRSPAGAEIIALSEHVDYWDHLGWHDPFSSPLFSARQQAYGGVFKTESVYTPQMIIDGLAELNGSDGERARELIKLAIRQPKADVRIQKSDSPGRVSVRVEQLAAAKVDKADVFLAITENRLSTNVPRGENAGRTLRHTGVVRSLVRIVEIEARRGAYTGDFQLQLQNGWHRDNARAVIFIQDQKTRRIVGAAACSL